jgi:hypothetical protein
MSGFLNFLRAKRASAAAVTLKFRLQYKEVSEDIYAFFESTDDAIFYLSDLRHALRPDAEIHRFICDGKAGVCYALHFAESTGRLRNAVFFVDKDLDDFVGEDIVTHERLFRTSYYSIENYIATEEAFKVIWEEHIQLPATSGAFKKALAGFRRAYRHLYTNLRPLTAWVIERRRERCDVLLANLNSGLECCFEFKDFILGSKAEFDQTFKTWCGHTSDQSTTSVVVHIDKELRKLPPKTWVRGKFELWLFLIYTNAVWKSLVGMPISRKKKVKKTLHLSNDNIFSLVGSKIRRPDGLSEFLATNLVK